MDYLINRKKPNKELSEYIRFHIYQFFLRAKWYIVGEDIFFLIKLERNV